MLGKVAVYVSNLQYGVKSRLKNRNGMEMLQMVIIIAIAVAMAAFFYTVFKSFVGTTDGANGTGFWGTLTTKVKNMFEQ